MKNIVFSDIDRTLAIEGVISRKNIDLIERYIKLGGTFILTSGRSVSYTKLIAKKIKGVRYIICTNGSIIYDLEKEKVLYANKIGYEHLKKLYEICNINDFKFIITSTSKDLVNKDALINQTLFTSLDKALYDKIDVTQVVIYGPDKEKILDIEKIINGMKDLSVINRSRALYDNNFINNKNYWLDVTKKGSNKGDGVLKMCKYLNVPIKDTIRVGDDLNDLPMFFDEGLNFCVDNAMFELKQKAGFITKSCAEDGVAYLLENIINGNLT